MHKPAILWWLNPVAVMVLLHLPLLVISYALPDWVYSRLWYTPKYFDGHAAALSALMILAWLMGYLLFQRRFVPDAWSGSGKVKNPEVLRTLLTISFVLTLMGYVAMVVAALSRGFSLSLLWSALQGEKNVMPQLKDVYFATIPGLTTLTQFGPATAVFAALLWKTEGWRVVRSRVVILLSLAGLRAIFISERLALLEVAIPMAILIARFTSFRQADGRPRIALTALPVYGAVAILALFAGSEYLRSWTNFYKEKGGDFSTFAVLRAAGYYSTAYNNSAFLLYNFDQPALIPYFTAEWIWRFPGLNLLLGEGPEIVADRYRNYMGVLKGGVNPEFNNSGGFLLPVIDYGVFGGFAFWFLVGLTCRRLFDSFRAFRFTGLLLYPVLMIGLLEASRLIYWTSGRTVPTFVMLASGVFVLNRASRNSGRSWFNMPAATTLAGRVDG